MTAKLRTTNSTLPRHLEWGAAADFHSIQLALGELWSVCGHCIIKRTPGEAGPTRMVLLLPCREKFARQPPLGAAALTERRNSGCVFLGSRYVAQASAPSITTQS